jgi:hypothetical protein
MLPRKTGKTRVECTEEYGTGWKIDWAHCIFRSRRSMTGIVRAISLKAGHPPVLWTHPSELQRPVRQTWFEIAVILLYDSCACM